MPTRSKLQSSAKKSSKPKKPGRLARIGGQISLAAILALLSAMAFFQPVLSFARAFSLAGAFLLPLAFLPSGWISGRRVSAVWGIICLTGIYVFSGIVQGDGPLFEALRFSLHGVAVLVFIFYIAHVLRHAADTRHPSPRTLRWWLWYPAVAVMLLAGISFFELQRYGMRPGNMVPALRSGLLPFSLAVLWGLWIRMLENLQAGAQRIIILASVAILEVGALAGLIQLYR